MVWGCEWCWYGQTKKVGRKSRRRSLLSHIMPSNGAHYDTPRWPAVFHFHARPSVHAAKKNLQFLGHDNYDLLDYPPKSHDVNPLDNIWWAIEQALLDKSLPYNANDLFDKLLKYIRSMPSRIEAVIQAKGWHTKY